MARTLALVVCLALVSCAGPEKAPVSAPRATRPPPAITEAAKTESNAMRSKKNAMRSKKTLKLDHKSSVAFHCTDTEMKSPRPLRVKAAFESDGFLTVEISQLAADCGISWMKARPSIRHTSKAIELAFSTSAGADCVCAYDVQPLRIPLGDVGPATSGAWKLVIIEGALRDTVFDAQLRDVLEKKE